MHLISMTARILVWLALIYGIYCALLFMLQRRMIFPVRFIDPPPNIPAHLAAHYETHWLEMDFGKVETWFLPPAGKDSEKPGPVIIAGHGNAELIDFYLQEFLAFAQAGVGVLLVEYPGYGRSHGKPSETSITDAFVAAYDMLVETNRARPSSIVFFGRSMGGGAVCRLAAKRTPAAMVLSSTYTSLFAFARNYYAPKAFIRDRFDNEAALLNYKGPVLIIHGTQDEMIPYEHAKTLARAAENSRLLSYDCGHNDCPPDPDTFRNEALNFLKANGVMP